LESIREVTHHPIVEILATEMSVACCRLNFENAIIDIKQ
jgi:hypothetical protein